MIEWHVDAQPGAHMPGWPTCELYTPADAVAVTPRCEEQVALTGTEGGDNGFPGLHMVKPSVVSTTNLQSQGEEK